MVITYHKKQYFKVVFGDMTLAFDPISKQKGEQVSKFSANLVLVSMNHPDFNGVQQVMSADKKSFLINGPGEYEFGDVIVIGYGVKTKYDNMDRYVTIYQVRMEGMNMVFLGALGSPEIESKILSEFGDIDILFVPIGGGDVINAVQASKLSVKLEAKLVIPMNYDNVALDTFLREESAKQVSPVDKLTLKRKDVMAMEGEIAVLKS